MFWMNYKEFLKVLIFLGMVFVCSVQPLIMVMSLIVITLFYSMLLNNLMGSYWYSYMLLLLVLSGVMVIFTYVVSLVSNEVFEMTNLLYLCMFLYLIILWVYDLSEDGMEDFSAEVVKMWETLMGLYNMFVVFFLMMMMLMVVWLSSMKKGALRNF